MKQNPAGQWLLWKNGAAAWMADFSKGNGYGKKEIAQNLQKIASDFNDIPVQMVPKVKVGVVGEIYVKYSRLGNNNLEELLAQEGCEVMIPGILNFVMYSMEVNLDDIALYGGSKAKAALVRRMMAYLCSIEKAMIDAVKQYPRFQAPSPFYHTKSLAKGIIGYGCKMGEGMAAHRGDGRTHRRRLMAISSAPSPLAACQPYRGQRYDPQAQRGVSHLQYRAHRL